MHIDFFWTFETEAPLRFALSGIDDTNRPFEKHDVLRVRTEKSPIKDLRERYESTEP